MMKNNFFNLNNSNLFKTNICKKTTIMMLFSAFLLVSCSDNFHYTASLGPFATDDLEVTGMSAPVKINVDGNDIDPAGGLDISTVTITSSPDCGGVATVGPASSFDILFTPPVNYTGTCTFTYEICNSNGQCDTADAVVTVVGNPPVVTDDITNANCPATPNCPPPNVNPLVNDTDPDNNIDPGSINITSGFCSLGSAPNYSITWTGPMPITGVETCEYEVCDLSNAIALCDTATVTFDGTLDPSQPVASDDSEIISANTPVVVNVDNNDSDPGNDIDLSSINLLTTGTNGNCVVGPAPTYDIIYTSNANFVGMDTCEYEICDMTSPTPLCDSAVLSVEVVGDVPVANHDNAGGDNSSPITIADVTSNDTDTDQGIDNTTVVIDPTQPQPPATNGVCDYSAAPAITFVPAAGFVGIATCPYQVCDLAVPVAECGTADATYHVSAPSTTGTSPFASDDTGTAPMNTPVNIPVNANDTDPDGDIDPSSITITTQPPATEGVCSIGPAPAYDVILTPAPNFVGTASCGYEINDLAGNGPSPATVEVVVTGDAPQLVNELAYVPSGGSVAVDPLLNDSDPDNGIDPSTLALTGNQIPDPIAEGVCSLDGSGNIVFTAVAGFIGTAVCEYEICDTTVATALCNTGELTVKVAPAPEAIDDNVTTPTGTPLVVDVDGNDTDADNNIDPSSISITTQPPATEGVCSVGPAPGYDVTFTPATNFVGTSTCTYEICDLTSPTPLCDTADVAVTVTGMSPVALDDTTNGSNLGPVTITDVTANDTDGDSNLDSTSVIVDPAGTLPNATTEGVCDYSSPPAVTFTAVSGYVGTASCPYEVCDLSTPTPLCDQALASFIIANTPPPVAVDDNVTTPTGTPLVVDVDGNDTDADNNIDPSSISITTQPPATEGVCSVGPAPGYDVTFTPATNFVGTSTCTYQICDLTSPTPLCDTADVAVTVTGMSPVAVDDTTNGSNLGPVTITDVTANDTDGDSNLDSTSVIVDPAGTLPNATTEGVCDYSAAPAITFTAVSGYVGTASCPYEVCDLSSPTPLCDQALASFVIAPADITAPTLTIEQGVAGESCGANQPDPTSVVPLCYDVIFSEDMDLTTIVASDFTLGGTAVWTGTPALTLTWDTGPDGMKKLKVEVNGTVSTDGTVILSMAAGMGDDLAGNNNVASTSVDNVITFDSTICVDVGPTYRISTNSSGDEHDNASELLVVSAADTGGISDDGVYVVFNSRATNLVPNDLNGERDLFLKNRVTGVVTRISEKLGGGDASYSASPPLNDNSVLNSVLTPDGNFVIYDSWKGDIVAGDANGTSDVFIYDRVAGTNTLLSKNSLGVPGAGPSLRPSISRDGRHVVFNSGDINLDSSYSGPVPPPPGVSTGSDYVYYLDRNTGVLSAVTDAAGVILTSSYSFISDDGNYLFYHGECSTTFSQACLLDMNTKAVTVMSKDSLGNHADGSVSGYYLGGNSFYTAGYKFSADNNLIVFTHSAPNLVGSTTNNRVQVYLYDSMADAITLLSKDTSGNAIVGGGHSSGNASITADGKYVTFQSSSADIAASDTNFYRDVFRYEVATGNNEQVSLNSDGTPISGLSGSFLGGHSAGPVISSNGEYVSFITRGTSYVCSDTNNIFDVVVRELTP